MVNDIERSGHALPEPKPLKRQLRHRWRNRRWQRLNRRGAGLGQLTGQTRNDPDLPDTAIVAVAMGERYTDWCLTMITSLRDAGQFAGPVYVITDRPVAFDGMDNIRLMAVAPTRYRLIAKSCKQIILQQVTESLALYLDSDLIVTAPIADWVAAMSPGLADYPMLCYPDVKPCPGAFHGGVVLLDTRRGMPIIGRWQNAVATGRWGSDQACLYSVAGVDGPGHLPELGMHFPEALIGQPQPADRCLVHITNGAMLNHPRQAMLSFLVDELGVRRIPVHFD